RYSLCTATHCPVLRCTHSAAEYRFSHHSRLHSTSRSTMASSSTAIVASAAAQPRTNDTLALPMSMSTTPALYVTRLVGAKTRFCPFCGNRFCGVFRPKRACVGCGGAMCDGCSSKMEATQGNQPLRVCPGCDARLKASPNFVDHIVARRERGEGFYRPVAAASSQTSPPPASP
ncbi:unnamed protein product, partial [Ectocarpus fasciculatus]